MIMCLPQKHLLQKQGMIYSSRGKLCQASVIRGHGCVKQRLCPLWASAPCASGDLTTLSGNRDVLREKEKYLQHCHLFCLMGDTEGEVTLLQPGAHLRHRFMVASSVTICKAMFDLPNAYIHHHVCQLQLDKSVIVSQLHSR